MKNFYAYLLKLTTLTGAILLPFAQEQVQAQACSTAQGNQTAYGANNVWIGYIYTGQSFNNYQGYTNEGTAASPNFNEGFGGSGATFTTNGCSVTADHFSARYKLTQTFTSGTYIITVGGDDGYRFSMDGDNSYAINNWNDHSYTTTTDTVVLNGTYNFVLEYYQDAGANEVSFNIVQICMGAGSQTTSGANNVWIGYLYQGMNFQTYKGSVTEGSSTSPFFDESFGNPGGSNTNSYATNTCSITTYQFSAIYRLTQTLSAGNYTFTVGGDDGFRFSIDGGNTWVINKWNDQSYITSAYTTWLPAGTYNYVLEYYDNGGYDRVTYNNTFTALPVTVNSWSASLQPGDKALLNWTTTNAVNFDHFVIQRSTDGDNFQDIATVAANNTDSSIEQKYTYTDQFTYNGDVFYRLQLVDRDGSASYSGIVNLPMQTSGAIRIYPTMVENGQLTDETPSEINQAKLELFDMTGRKLMVQNWSQLQGRQQVSIAANSRLAAGAYIVRLSDSQSILAKQIIIVK